MEQGCYVCSMRYILIHIFMVIYILFVVSLLELEIVSTLFHFSLKRKAKQ